MNTAQSKNRHYPSLRVGQSILIDRPECGVNHFTNQSKAPDMLIGKFVYSRPRQKPSRSRYAPHIGKKQLARA